MRSHAAVARAAGYPLSIATIGVDGSKAGEVFTRIVAIGTCHTDTRTLPGAGFGGLIRLVLGHDGAGAGQKIGARPVRHGAAFGGVGSRLESPGHFDRYMKGQTHIDETATHRMPPADANRGFDLMHERASIRAAITS